MANNNVLVGGWNKKIKKLSDDPSFRKKALDAKYIKIDTYISGDSGVAAAVDFDGLLMFEKEQSSLTEITTEDFSGVKPLIWGASPNDEELEHYPFINTFENLKSQPHLSPSMLDGVFGRSAFVAPRISGKNHITMWRCMTSGRDGSITNYRNALEWAIPGWIAHEDDFSTPTTLKIDDSSEEFLPAFNHFWEHSNGPRLSNHHRGYQGSSFANAKVIEVTDISSTYSGPICQVKASGSTTITGAYYFTEQFNPILSDYEKPIILETGKTYLASCLIKTEGVSLANGVVQDKKKKLLQGAGFTVSELEEAGLVNFVANSGFDGAWFTNAQGNLQPHTWNATNADVGRSTDTPDNSQYSITFTGTTSSSANGFQVFAESGSALANFLNGREISFGAWMKRPSGSTGFCRLRHIDNLGSTPITNNNADFDVPEDGEWHLITGASTPATNGAQGIQFFRNSHTDEFIVGGVYVSYGNGLVQTSETPMAGGLVGDTDFTYCGIVFTPSKPIVNINLYLRNAVGKCTFTDFRLGVLDENMDNLTIPNHVLHSGPLSYSRMNLYKMAFKPASSSTGVTVPQTLNSLNPGASNDTSQIVNSELIISGATSTHWEHEYLGVRYGDCVSINRDKKFVEPTLRLNDEFNEEGTARLYSLCSSGHSTNQYICGGLPYHNWSTEISGGPKKHIHSCWYYIDGDNLPSGNVLMKSIRNSSAEFLGASTEPNKWLYQEFESSTEAHVDAKNELLVGIHEGVDPDGVGVIKFNSLMSFPWDTALDKYDSIRGWTPITGQQTSGFISVDKNERLDYYNWQSDLITRVSSREGGVLGLQQEISLEPSKKYTLKTVYKNQPYGAQNIIPKSESIWQTTPSEFDTWSTTGTVLFEPSTIAPAGFSIPQRFTKFGLDVPPTPATLSITGMPVNYHNMGDGLAGRQFILKGYLRPIVGDNIDEAKIELISEPSSETHGFDFIDGVNGFVDGEWKQFTFITTFTGPDEFLTLKITISDSSQTGDCWLGLLQLYETDNTYVDGIYVEDAGTEPVTPIKSYAATSQHPCGYPDIYASGLYWTLFSSGSDGVVNYLQSDMETYSIGEYQHPLALSSGNVFDIDSVFTSDTRTDVDYVFFIGTSGNVLPECSWLYHIQIHENASNLIDENNPLSTGVLFRSNNKRSVLHPNNLSENRSSNVINVITSGGTFPGTSSMFSDSLSFTSNTISKNPGSLDSVDVEIVNPDSYGFAIDDLKYGKVSFLESPSYGIDAIDPDTAVTIFSKAGGITDISLIPTLEHNKLLTDAQLSWGKTRETFSKATVFGTEYESDRTARHVISVHQIDKKGRDTKIAFEEFAKLSSVNPDQLGLIQEGYRTERVKDEVVDKQISVPVNMADYATPDTARQAFGTIYPTIDITDPSQPRQCGDGIMFKEGLKRFCSLTIKNPDFVDNDGSGGALYWNYVNITQNGSLSYKEQLFGPTSLCLTPTSGSNYVWQRRQWADNWNREFTTSFWYKADMGSYALVSAINEDTGVEYIIRKEGTGSWEKAYLTLIANSASRPIDPGQVLVDQYGNVITNMVNFNNGIQKNKWLFRIWSTTSEHGGMGSGPVYIDGFNVIQGKPYFNVTDAELGSNGLNVRWDVDNKLLDSTGGDVNAYVFSKIVGFGYSNTHRNAANYIDLNTIDGFEIEKTKEFEVKFLSQLYKALLIARNKVNSSSVTSFFIDVETPVLPFIDVQDVVRLNDPNNGIQNEYFAVVSIDSNIEAGDSSSRISLRRV